MRCEFRCFHDVLNSLVCRDPEYVSTAFQWHAPRFGGIVVISEERRKYAALFSRFCTVIGNTAIADFLSLGSYIIFRNPKRKRAFNVISFHELRYRIRVQRKSYTRGNGLFSLSYTQVMLEKNS